MNEANEVKQPNDRNVGDQPLVTSRPANVSRLLDWAMWCLEETKESVREGCFEMYSQVFADKAVEMGFMRYEEYDPEKHPNINADDGDMIYCWDNRQPLGANQQSPSS